MGMVMVMGIGLVMGMGMVMGMVMGVGMVMVGGVRCGLVGPVRAASPRRLAEGSGVFQRTIRYGACVLLFLAALLSVHGNVRAQSTARVQPVGNIHLEFWPENEALAHALAATIRPLPVLPADILDAPPPILIQLAPDEARFDSLTGGRAPDWGAGVAFPDRGMIVLPAYQSARGATHSLDQVLRHELAHVGLQRFMGPARIPRWFSEGYATWAAGQFDPEAGWFLRLAFLTGRAPPLDSLIIDWPAASIDARVAYLLSASAVAWLHEHGGDRVFAIFLDRWQETRNFEASLYDVYGLNLGQLERDWSKTVRRRYGWLLFLAQSAVIWAIVSIIAIGFFIIRRRRNRARLERLRATEIPDDPAFWLTDENAARNDHPGPDAGPDPHAASSDPTGRDPPAAS